MVLHPKCTHKAISSLLGEKGESFSDLNEAEKKQAWLYSSSQWKMSLKNYLNFFFFETLIRVYSRDFLNFISS